MEGAAFKPAETMSAQQVAALWVGPNGTPAPAIGAPTFNPGDVIEGPKTVPGQR
jgi:hypothetical protein